MTCSKCTSAGARYVPSTAQPSLVTLEVSRRNDRKRRASLLPRMRTNMVSDNEVYTPREIALAAGVSETQVLEALGHRPGDRLPYVQHKDAVRFGRDLAKVGRTPFSPALPFSKGMKPLVAERVAWSGMIHGGIVAAFLVIATSN